MTTTLHPPAPAVLITHDAVPVVAATLAAAFDNDPIFTWVAPDPALRRAGLPGWFAVAAAGLERHGRSWQSAACSAAALWVPPSTEPLSEAEGVLLGEATAPLGAGAMERSGVISAAMEAVHPQEPHHYLWLLGVSPDQQGAGLGTGLLAQYLTQLDSAGEAAYLEATSPQNRRLYERHGFEVTGVIQAENSPPLWAMWREPRGIDG
ncbi:GNAT family N-acetyltransferase [Phycicoccus flavus]|uniref:GNAT family N-acetyltransferase n=1 Tax=Phycicoccus flavus TaxID=2502783 RepID=UPI000FEBF201|nr:GNAT family N-acetyltransferase [Phycicoccus flavus]NHA69479.1 GNAT family N-acetyltransferase [Phycicoccus flavus]